MRTWITTRSEVLKIVGTWLACLLILCGAWLGSILYFLENARRANTIRLTAHRIRIHELEARRAEKDFVLRSLTDPAFFEEGRSQYLERQQAEVELLRRAIEKLGEHGSPAQKARPRRLLELVERYEHGVAELVSAYRERGFQQWGLRGVLQDEGGRLQRAVEEKESARFARAILNLNRDEQGFLLYGSPELAAQVTADLAMLREAVLTETLPSQEQAALQAMDKYEAAFTKLRSLEEKIGFTPGLGLQSELRQAIHAVEPVVEEILVDTARAGEQANRTLMIGLLATCFIMAVLLALAVFYAQAARLHTRKLVQVNQEIEESHRKILQSERLAAIGQMVTGLAHESRNAFQRTHACLDMLSQKLKDRPEALDLVARIEEAQDHLHLLYEQVREYAAPLQMKRGPTRLQEIVDSAWASLDLLRAGREVHFAQHTNGTETRCEVDGFAIEQVFRNIFENSLAACQDPVNIEVDYREDRAAGKAGIQISVHDNGPGLDQEQRARIFDPFYTTKTKGTGLGMAIAKRLVEAHDGVIEVGAGKRPGAEIVVTLPGGA